MDSKERFSVFKVESPHPRADDLPFAILDHKSLDAGFAIAYSFTCEEATFICKALNNFDALTEIGKVLVN